MIKRRTCSHTLADQLRTTVEHLWAVLIRQAYVSAITQGAACLVALAILVWGLRFVVHTWKHSAAGDDLLDQDVVRFWCMVAGRHVRARSFDPPHGATAHRGIDRCDVVHSADP